MKMRRVLIIEDEPEIRLILSTALRHSGDFETVQACDGIEGIEIARAEKPDLILIDVLMPRMDGYSTCKAIKEDSELKEIPVIFLTAKTDRKEIDLAIRAGACGYLTKPFDPLSLASDIDKVLRGVKNT